MLALENSISRRDIREFTVKIEAVRLYPMGDDDIADMSHVVVEKKGILQGKIPEEYGVYDRAMGVTNMNNASEICTTCYNDAQVCPGHHGRLFLKYPVKSQIHLQIIMNWLKATCESCGSLVVHPSKQSPYTLSHLSTVGKRTAICYKCKIPHSVFCTEKSLPWVINRSTPDGRTTTYYNHRIKEHFERVSDETVLLVAKTLLCHPKKYVNWTLLVPSNTTRQEIEQSSGHGRGSNDVTTLLGLIVGTNQKLPDNIPLSDDLISREVRALYEELEFFVYSMQHGTSANSRMPKVMARKSNKPYQSLLQRAPKKKGRIRGDLLGKRVFVMARGVITGDPHIRPYEVGLPLRIVKNLFIPERVSEENYEKMILYLANKDQYPGCSRIVRIQNGKPYRAKNMDDYVLEIGDVVYRHIINGDIIDFGRQPSLNESSLSAVTVVVMHHGDTIRMNPSMCNFYNADFDGDAMLEVGFQDPLPRAERSIVGSITNWMVSAENIKPMIGLFYDSIISVSRMTRSNAPRIHKSVAMQMCAKTTVPMKFDKEWYTGRELVEKVLPFINLTGTAKMYMKSFSPPVQYNPDDVHLVIRGGKYISGVMDKSTVGQGSRGSLFHKIYLRYGAKKAFDVIFEMQQMVEGFIMYEGFTIGYDSVYVDPDTRRTINEKLAMQIESSNRIVERMDRGELFSPINQTAKDFLENELLTALSSDGSLVKCVLEKINVFENPMFQMVMSGMKGSMGNLESSSASIGQRLVRGGLPPMKFGYFRTLPWSRRYEMTPESRGFIPQSYIEGISPAAFYFGAYEARSGLEDTQSKTAASGTMTRLCTRNMEILAVRYNRTIGRLSNSVTQFLFAGNGFNLRKLQKIKIPGLVKSSKEFFDTVDVDMKTLHSRYRHSKMESLMNDRSDFLFENRLVIQKIVIDVSNTNYSHEFDTRWFFPANPEHIVDSVVSEFHDSIGDLDPVKSIEQVEALITRLPYIYFNRFYEGRSGNIPVYMRTSLEILCYVIRIQLCVKVLVSKKITNHILDRICDEIFARLKMGLLEPGTNIGVLVSQCVTAPITQHSLDAKHRVGLNLGSRTSASLRISEIISVTETDNMRNPRMLLYAFRENEESQARMQEIANSIEMLYLDHFIYEAQLFYEDFGEPTHPRYAYEKSWIDSFLKKNDQAVPGDLSKWCIRVDVDSRKMILKSITMLDIVQALQDEISGCFIVYTPSLDTNSKMRVYFRNNALPKGADGDKAITTMRDYLPEFVNTVVRGVDEVKMASVLSYRKPEIQEDGSVDIKEYYFVETLGTNLVETLLRFPMLDASRCRSDSVREMEEIFGIEAAAIVIENEFATTLPGSVLPENVSLFVDEMCSLGMVTSLQLSGLTARNRNNAFLQMALQDPAKAIKKSSERATINPMEGISAPLCMGIIPTSGTTCHEVLIDDDFIVSNRKSAGDLLRDLEKEME